MKGLYVTLIRREFWECKMQWVAPLAAAAGLIGGAMFQNIQSATPFASYPTNAIGSMAVSVLSLISATTLLGIVAGLALFAYLLDCLNAERRDRSILFWKSLPVSDTQTVLAKVAVAALVVPLGTILLIFLTQPIIWLITWVRFENMRPYINFGLLAAWPPMLARIGLLWVFCVLWFAPVGTWLMLASVLAKRAPLAYAALPPLALILWERVMPGATHLTRFVVERLFPWQTRLFLVTGGNPRVAGEAPSVAPQWWVPFQDPGLWIGLAVAAGMLYIVIRLRRYRDDT
jgi:ABC-2 type transport system permease protein